MADQFLKKTVTHLNMDSPKGDYARRKALICFNDICIYIIYVYIIYIYIYICVYIYIYVYVDMR